MAPAILGNEGTTELAFATIQVQQGLAAAAKKKAEAEKLRAETKKAQQMMFMKFVDNASRENEALRQEKGDMMIGAIQNVAQKVDQVSQKVDHAGSFLAQKVDNAEQNLTGEFKTRYGPKPV
jgi:hypothetical protein